MTAEILCDIAENPVPPHARAGFFTTSDNVSIRYALFKRTAEPARGTICLVQGRTEFIEKYFETITDFQKRGFAVATFDFRGQGGSQRLTRHKHLGYVDKFDDYWTDLRDFHQQILLPECPPPFHLVGHSMGGLVSLLAAVRDRLMFDRMLLSAPMLALDRQPLSMAGMARLTETLCFLGLGQVPIARRQDQPLTEQSFPTNPLTSDKARYLRNLAVLKARPDLEVGAPAVRWVAAAMRAMARIAHADFPVAVRVPVLMLAAARDTVVSTNTIESLGLRMRLGRHAVLPAAKHELLMETDEVRSQLFAAFDAFITERTL